ncbi:peptidoglycan recognition protein 4-like isoform X2 [Chironomus tepperi]|uniref:peptidoglycan recognition protein 4-like isoform X2 n=1 Tax=Chironomus tepperi TaxID=113505 RepID=UPI00391F9705
MDINRQFQRNDSFSTIDSSIAAADIARQYVDLSRPAASAPVPVMAASIPPNMKFEKSENINVIYNNYYNNPSPERKPSRNNSFTSFLSITRKTKVVENLIKFLRTKRGAGIAIVLLIVVLSVIASVVSYYVIRANKTNDLDSTTTIITPDPTTTITLDPGTTTTDSDATTTTTDTTTTTTDTTTTTTTTPESTDTVTDEPITDPSNSTTETTTTEDTTTTTTTTTTQSTTTSTTTSQPTTTESNLYPEFFMTRDDWGAELPRSSNITKLQTPIKRIIIGHTGGRFCTNQTDCIEAVKSIQIQDFSLEDIPYNFLIGADGNVYEGRGFGYQGQHTRNIAATEYNSIGIMIAFIGNYKSTSPSLDQIILLENFIKFFQESGNISSQYLIFSQDDLMHRDLTADSLNSAVANMKNYHSLYTVHRREEWGALTPKSLPKFNRTMNWNIIGHITNQGCSDLAGCIKEVKKVETDQLKSEYDDIVYNFLVAGRGILFEGRGWDIIGQSTLLPNAGISVIVLGKLTEDYKVFGRSDFGQPGPGALLMDQIKLWPRYGNKTTT